MSDLDLVRRIAAATHLAVLATTRADGTVHVSLVNAGTLDDPITGEPAVGVVVGGDAYKLGHLRRNGRAAAVFQHGYEWAAVEGPVRIIGPDDDTGVNSAELPELLRRVFVAAGGTHDNWAEYDRVMAEQRRAAVFIQPTRISGNG